MEADYLVVGAGAMGLAFTDVLMTESDATVVIVDRRDQPGGHWNDAYPFVRLHQPSSFYGVSSRQLGSDRIDSHGWNKGMYELAGKSEICAYFDQVMQGFLRSGRVQYFPMCEYQGDDVVSSVISDTRHQVIAGKVVDASYMNVNVPATQPPAFEVAEGVNCVPPNALARVSGQWENYVIVGAGKTAMDAGIFLLENGLDPNRISWVKPRDSWLFDRAKAQAGALFEESILSLARGQITAAADSDSIEDLFARTSADGNLVRIDETIAPTMYRCATASQREIEELRRIRNVIRMGRVQRIEANSIVLDQGTVATGPNTLHINCTADGLERRPPLPVFGDKKITLQSVRTCQQVFSAAFIAHIEVSKRDEALKNLLCTPVPHPDTDIDYMRSLLADLANRAQWAQDESLMSWLKNARLDGWSSADSSPAADTEVAQRLGPVAMVAAQKLMGYLSALPSG
jgi:hypothetical protein